MVLQVGRAVVMPAVAASLAVLAVATGPSPVRAAGLGTQAAAVLAPYDHGTCSPYVSIFSPDGRVVLVPGNREAETFSATTGRLLHGLAQTYGQATFSPDGKLVLTVTMRTGGDERAELWDTATGKPLQALGPWHADNSICGAFSPDGRRVVLSFTAGAASELWDAASGRLVRRLPAMPGNDVVFSPDGRLLLAGGSVFDASNGKLVHALTDGAYTEVFSPDGRLILTLNGKQANLWQTATGNHLATFGNGVAIEDGSFSPDGRLVATASADETARLWSTTTGTLVRTLRHDTTVLTAVFSPDGKLLLTSSGEKAGVWRVATGQLLLTLRAAAPGSAVFSPKGNTILTSTADGPLDEYPALLWQTSSGRLLHTLSAVGAVPPGAGTLATSAIAAMAAQRSYHYVSSQVDPSAGGARVTMVGDASRTEGIQRITVSKTFQTGHATELVVANTAYVRGDAVALASLLGLPASEAATFAGKWVSIAPSSSMFPSVAADVRLDSSALESLNMPSSARDVGTSVVHGRHVTGLRATVPYAGATGVKTLYVRATGSPLPVELTVTHNRKLLADIVYGGWGEPVHVSAPSGAVSLPSA